jgi:hypothetical protein
LANSTGGFGTAAQGIYGNTVVGYYLNSNSVNEGFEVTTPEPTALCDVPLGAIILSRRAGRRRRAKLAD